MDHQTARRLLADFARGLLDPADFAAVQIHVSGCAACEELLRFARDIHLIRQPRRRVWAPWWEPVRAFWVTPDTGPWRIVAASAAVVAVILAYPAYQGTVQVPSLRQAQVRLVEERDQARARGEDLARQVQEAQTSHGAGPTWTGGVNMLVLAGTSRAAEAELPRLSLRTGQTVQPVLAGYDLTRGGSLQRTIVLAIRPVESTSNVWTHRCTAREVWDGPNQLVSVLVPARVLTKGSYELMISEAAASSPVYRAPFRLDTVAR